MRGTWLMLTGIILCLGLVGPTLLGGASAQAGPKGVKFFVVDWRLTWTEGEEKLSLTMKGRTRGISGDLGDEFEMTTTKVTPVLDILRTCAMGRLVGTAVTSDTNDGKVVGDDLTSLTCRAILK